MMRKYTIQQLWVMQFMGSVSDWSWVTKDEPLSSLLSL